MPPGSLKYLRRAQKLRPADGTGCVKAVKNKKTVLYFTIFLLFLWLLYCFLQIVDNRLRPNLNLIAATLAHQTATEVIYEIVYQNILPEAQYEKLIVIHKDTQNRINFIQADSIEIGKIAVKTGRLIKGELKKIEEYKIAIPLGQVLDISLLAGRGPKLNVKLIPMGTVDVAVTDELQQAGINQVKHTIYLNIKTKINIVVPLVSKEEVVEIQIPLAESVIVGPVPDAYLGGSLTLHSTADLY